MLLAGALAGATAVLAIVTLVWILSLLLPVGGNAEVSP